MTPDCDHNDANTERSRTGGCLERMNPRAFQSVDLLPSVMTSQDSTLMNYHISQYSYDNDRDECENYHCLHHSSRAFDLSPRVGLHEAIS